LVTGQERLVWPTRADVLRIVGRDFAPPDQAVALDILDRYPASIFDLFDLELDGVHLCILKVSGGDVELLRRFTDRAKDDIRDVVYPALHPRLLLYNHADPEISRLAREADREEYQSWFDRT
jgi:hypothetical protein